MVHSVGHKYLAHVGVEYILCSLDRRHVFRGLQPRHLERNPDRIKMHVYVAVVAGEQSPQHRQGRIKMNETLRTAIGVAIWLGYCAGLWWLATHPEMPLR